MNEQRYTPDELKRILQQAAADDPPPEGYSWDDIEQAALAAGIDTKRLRRAEAQVAARRGRVGTRIVAALATSAAALALLLAARSPGAASRTQELVVHNEQSMRAATVAILQPKFPGDCDEDWSNRDSAFCEVSSVRIPHGERLTLQLPEHALACGHVRIRVRSPRRHIQAAHVALPAVIEVERDGALDEKGMRQDKLQLVPVTTKEVEPCNSTK